MENILYYIINFNCFYGHENYYINIFFVFLNRFKYFNIIFKLLNNNLQKKPNFILNFH